MTPPPRGRGRGREPDQMPPHLRRKRRERVRKHRRRVAHFVAGTALAICLVMLVSGFTGGAVWMSAGALTPLPPVDVGQTSFVYAADGSLLGSIPAEKNRQPVDLS